MPKLPANFKRSPVGRSNTPSRNDGGSTSRNAWKAFERKVAAMFGAKRTPLSGSMSGHTCSDSLHPELFIEAKFRAKSPTWDLFRKTEEMARIEGKTPIVALQKKGAHGFLLVLRPEDLETIYRIYHEQHSNTSGKG